MMSHKRTVSLVIIAIFSVFYGVCWAEGEPQALDGITKPVADVELSFVQPGKIKQVMVEEGDLVEQGVILVALDDEIEQIQKKILTGRSENGVPTELAKVELVQNEKNLINLKRAQEKGATSEWEVDHATLAVDTALLKLKVKQFERRQDALKLQSLLGLIERLTIKSPVKGIVEDIMVEPGETVQAMVPVLRLVEIDPLVIDLPVPVDQAVTLTVGQSGRVTFLDTTELVGTITHIASIADAAATTLSVTLRVENSERRPAGERVSVVFNNN